MPDSESRWYVVHTYSGYENKVASNLKTTVENRGLENLIQEIRVPTEMVTEIKDNKPKEVERKVFPGYVLVKMVMNDDAWYVVRNIRGCTGFVGPNSKPVALTDEEVERMGLNFKPVELSDEEADKTGFEEKKIEVDYDVGDSVRIINSPFEDSVGVVDFLDKQKNCVRVIIHMLGRETPVELKLTQVEPL